MQGVQFTFKWVQRLVLMQILGILIPNKQDVFLVIIYLFRLYVLFSQYRSCDNTLENCFFQITPYPRAYLRIIYEETKGQVPLGPLMRKQNLQANEDCWGEATETLVSRIQTHTHASGIRTPIPRCLLFVFAFGSRFYRPI